MIIASEPRSPSSSSLEFIQRAAEAIRPGANTPPVLASKYETYVRTHSAWLAFDLDMVSDATGADADILEVGAIPLLLTGALQHAGYRPIAVDIEPERYVESIEKLDLDVRKCNIEEEPLPFEDNSFDLVLFNEVFEHLRLNLIFTMQETLRVLRPGGKLLLSTPNLRSLYGLKNFLWWDRAYSCLTGIYEQFDKLEKHGGMGHVREYTVTEVCEFLEDLGYQVQKVVYRGDCRGRFSTLSKVFPSLRPFFSLIALKP